MPAAVRPMAELRSVAPMLLVADVQRTAVYFRDVLGFDVPRFWNEPPDFAIASRGHTSVMLRQWRPQETPKPNAAYEDALDAYFWVSDADALHAEYAGKGADIVCAPVNQDYGMREFTVRAPDGHVLVFGGSIEARA